LIKFIPFVTSFVKYGRNFPMELQKIAKFEDLISEDSSLGSAYRKHIQIGDFVYSSTPSSHPLVMPLIMTID
jgi:hypothetical protein